MKDIQHINTEAWAHTPRDTIAYTDHLLDAWGDVFCSQRVGAKLGITFERFIETPQYHLHRMRFRSANYTSDRLLDYWGDIFCKQDLGKRKGLRFEQFLATPNYYLCSPLTRGARGVTNH